MSELLLGIADRIAIVLVLVLLWAATMVYIYRDMSQRNLPGWQQALWVLVSLLPFVGFLAYLAGRVRKRPTARRRALAAAPSAPAPRRVTLLQAPSTRLPTIPVGVGLKPPAGPAPVSARFTATEGAHRGQEFVVDRFPAQIGREPDCSVRLDQDLAVSRRHAELYVRDGQLRIRDLNSTHGTRVNSQRTTDVELVRGDRVQAGNTALILRAVRGGR